MPVRSHPFRLLRNLNRTRQIATVLLRYGFGDLLERLPLRRYARWGKRVILRKTDTEVPGSSRGKRIRLALESLGATFIKFGQVLSTRPDLIPADVVEELSILQENVPPFPSSLAVKAIEEALHAPLDVLFEQFDETPIAAGSLAQVHQAWLHDGTKVAVKIRRPKVVRVVERDLSLMTELALLVEKYIPELQIFDPVGLVQHFSRTIRRELNFTREAHSIEEFQRQFERDASLYVPQVFWKFTSESVLTMEFIDGHRANNRNELVAAGMSPTVIARNGAHIFMKQAFELGLFHGDPHPGNLRILKDGSLCLLDFGMVGSLDDERREQLVDLLVAVSRRDVHSTVDLVLRIGKSREPADLPQLRADIRDFVSDYYGIPLERLNVGALLNDFVTILASHQVRCPPNLMLLIRSMVTLEGVGRELDPEFNLATHLAPFVERMVKERYQLKNLAARFLSEGRHFLRIAHDLPVHLGRTLEKLSNDELKIRWEHQELDRVVVEMQRSSNRQVVSVVMSSLMVAGSVMLLSDRFPLWSSIAFFITAGVLGLWLIYGVLRSGRL